MSWRKRIERAHKTLNGVEKILHQRGALNIKDIIKLLPKENRVLTTRQLAQWMSRSGRFTRREKGRKSRWSLKP